jgi:hypothetical protein
VKKPEEKRTQVLRRQFNESFCDQNGHIMIAKVIAVAAQIMVLFYSSRYFVDMMGKPETLLICLSFLIAPDIFRKALNMKYGGNGTPTK